MRFSGRKLKEYRTAAGMAVKPFAASLGCSTVSLWRFETGKVDPPANVVAHMATVLGLEPGDLFEPGPVEVAG